MGCVSSKQARKDLKRERVTIINNNGGSGYVNHIVSLTSSTYGALRLDNDHKPSILQQQQPKPSSSPSKEPEVINAWELMEGLEDGGIPISNQPKKSPKSSPFLRGFIAPDAQSPLKFLNQFGSPRTVKKNKVSGKENRVQVRSLDYSNSPKGIVLKSSNSSPNPSFQLKGSPICGKRNSFGNKSSSCSRRPLFDPELLASYEKELSEEEEQIKRMVWATPKGRSMRKSAAEDLHSLVLSMFEEKCPPGGENSVVIYTTTLRGIRKTFEDCNKVRSIVESHCVHLLERDVSMDSGFKEELRKLMGTNQVKVPVVFVKGRLVGGAEQVLKLEEEGKLDFLFEGIPKALSSGCQGCAGVRFVMCKECNGSCKVLDEEKKNTVRCSRCNENGIVQCPICR